MKLETRLFGFELETRLFGFELQKLFFLINIKTIEIFDD